MVSQRRALWAGGLPVLVSAAAILLSACSQLGAAEATSLSHLDGPERDEGLVGGAPASWTSADDLESGATVACGWDTADQDEDEASVPTAVVVHHGDDEARLTLDPAGGSQIEVWVDGMVHAVYQPATFHPGDLQVHADIVGNGTLEARMDNRGVLIEGRLAGRELDLASNGSRYADGSAVPYVVTAGTPTDGGPRFQQIVVDLMRGLESCASDLPSVAPAVCPTLGTPGVSAESGAANPGQCTACHIGNAIAHAICAGIVSAACTALVNPIAILICILIGVIFFCLVIFFAGLAACFNSTCCPVRCGTGCCPRGASCLENGRCCANPCPGGEVCCGSGTTCLASAQVEDPPTCSTELGDTVCCPTASVCGPNCCPAAASGSANLNMCADPTIGACCEGPAEGERPNAGGVCPGAPGGDGTPAGCCSPTEACDGTGQCCDSGSECRAFSTSPANGFCCNAGDPCTLNPQTFIAFPTGACCPPGEHPCTCGGGCAFTVCVSGACPENTTGPCTALCPDGASTPYAPAP